MQNMRANIENQLIDMGLGEEQGNPVVWDWIPVFGIEHGHQWILNRF